MNAEAERLRLVSALVLPEPRPVPCEEDVDRLWAAASGELRPQELSAVLAHVRECAECAEAYQLAVRTEQPAMVQLPSEPSPANTRRWLWPAVALAAAAGLVMMLLPAQPEPAYRSNTQVELRLLIPDGTAVSAGTSLTWEAGDPGTRYAVILTTDALVVVARREGLRTPRLELDAAMLGDLPEGTAVNWQVIATSANGTRTQSAPGRLRIGPPR